jgi:uncharacterized protein (UPF0276 family)
MHVLEQVADRYPIVMHGVSMSIGSTDPLDMEYLGKLKALADRTRALWVSDHLCWTASPGATPTTCCRCRTRRRRCATWQHRVRSVADVLERPLMLENASTYAEFTASSMPEQEFFGASWRRRTAACSSTSTTST